MLLQSKVSGSRELRNDVSPVIITSLEGHKSPKPREGAKSIIFDVRSETPNSQVRHTPNIGLHEDAKTRNISQVDSEAVF